jgi:valyl-tRNA synthetase
VLDPDRKKMSKSKGNVVTPIGLLDQYGADAVRYWSASARLGVDTAFDEQELRVGGRLVTKLFNAAKYVLTQPVPPLPDGADFASFITEPLDRAFMAELQTLVDRATASFEEYEFGPALQATESFFWGTFTDNYLELVKGRARGELGEAAQRSAVLTLRLGMNVLLRLFAPILPNVTEEAWSWAFAEETGQPSIHRAPWPSASELPVGAGSDTAGVFGAVCDAVAAVRKAKTVAKIGLGYDLTSATISGSAADLRLLEPVREDLRLASRAATLELRELAERPDSTFLASIAFVPRQAKEPV